MNHKWHSRQLKYESNMTMNSMHLDETIQTIKEFLDSPLSKFITLAANDCGYSGSAEDLIVNYVHPLFLKAKAEASTEDNLNCRQAMSLLLVLPSPMMKSVIVILLLNFHIQNQRDVSSRIPHQ